jgi:hypothetical protein
MPRKWPEDKAVELLRQGKAVFTQRSWDPKVPTVREAYRSLPEWLARRGGIFAWDRMPYDHDDWIWKRASRHCDREVCDVSAVET